MHDDDDSDHGLSAMMARTVNASTSRPSRSREGGEDGRKRGSSRSRSRSSSVARKLKGSKKKDSAPPTPRRRKSRDSGHGNDRGLVSRSKSVRRSKSRDSGHGDDRSGASRSKSVRRSKSRDSGFDFDKSVASRSKSVRRTKSRDSGFDDDKSVASRSKSVRRTKSRDSGFDDDRSHASRSKSVRRTKSRDSGFDDDKSVAKSMKSTKSRVAKKKKSEKSEKSSPNKTELVSHNSGSVGSKDSCDEQSVTRRKSKKKSKKIKRIKSAGSSEGSGSDEHTILSKQSTRSTKSSRSAMSSASKARSTRNKVSKQYKETSSRVEAIQEPILSNEGVLIKDEMDNLFPLPTSPGSNVRKPTRRSSIGKANAFNSDTEVGPHSQRSISSASNYSIMTNKAAEERAESALNRVAASKQTESSGGSDAPGGERKFSRRLSNGSARSKEEYQRLHRDSGLTSLASSNDKEDDAKSFTSRRSQSKLTAMSAMHKQIEEYGVETENLQKLLYEALAEVEQSNTNLRRETERADTAEGDISGMKSNLEDIQEEKVFLTESINDLEKAFAVKDERVEKLQEVVEMQLDSVEFLEDKLTKTEEELVLMEDEITELIDIVEEKNNSTSTEQIKEVKSKGQGRVSRMVSMKEDMINRKDSIKTQKEESRRVLDSHDHLKSADRSRMPSMMAPVNENQVDVEKLENELKAREEKLKADKEECDNREQRLDAWEKELFDLEDQLKNEDEKIGVAKKDVASENSEHESLIASLEEEKDSLRRIQINNKSILKKLEIENEDLRLKLDRVTKMATANTKELPVKNSDLADALALVDKKDKVIKGLEEKIDRLGEKGDNDEEEGKDLLIRELQNQLVNSKKEANSLSSGSYITRLKLEIKKLRQSVLDLKKRLKDDMASSRLNLQRRDDSMKLLEKQMQKLKIELERRDKREKNLGADKNISNSDLENHIEDLEDEISHWKSTNADLENEIENSKSRVDDQNNDYYLSEDDIDDDDCSIGSLASVNSRMSLSVSHEDNFFLTDSTHSMGDMGDPTATPNRAIRTVSNLWSKMRNGPEPPKTVQAFPYAPGSLDD